MSPDRVGYSPDPLGGDQGSNTRLFRILWKGKWLILCLPALFAGLTWAYLRGKGPFEGVEPVWRATAKVIVRHREVDPMHGSSGSTGTKPRNLLNQQVALLKSDSILRPLAARPELAELRHFKERGSRPVIAVLNQGLKASVSPSSDMLQIHFDSHYRTGAARVADMATEVYLDYHAQRRVEEARQIIDLLRDEREKTVSELNDVDEQILDLKRTHVELVTNQQGGTLVGGQLQDLYGKLAEAQDAVRVAEGEVLRLEDAREDPDQWILVGMAYRDQRQIQSKEDKYKAAKDTRIDLEKEVEGLITAGMVETSPRILDHLSQIERLRQQEDEIVLEYAEARYTSAKADLNQARRLEQSRQNGYDQLRDEVNDIEAASASLERLQDSKKLIKKELDALIERMGELELSGEAGALHLTKMEAARLSARPISPDYQQSIGFAVALGLGLALGVVLLRGFRDHRIMTVEEVPELFGTSVLAVFPRLASSKGRAQIGRIVEREQGSLAAEAVRSVRTATTFALPDNGSGVALVTSSVAGEGKSVTSSNLAIALAQAGRRTVLVDADLRSPGQNEIYSVSGKVGMGDVLNGVAPLHKAIVRDVVPGMDLLPAGDADNKAAELIESRGCRELFAKLRERYDCVVVDSSPVLETSEARVLASLADVTLFVLRLEASAAPDAVRSRDILKGVHARILGVVLNGYRTRKGAKAYAEGIAYGGAYPRHGDERRPPAEAPSRVASESSESSLKAWS